MAARPSPVAACALALTILAMLTAARAAPVFTTEFRLESSHPDTAAAVMQFLSAIGVTIDILNVTVSPV
jgi:hypothetical protein